MISAKLQGFGNMTLVDAVEKMAVMDQESRPQASSRCKLRQHQIEAEDLHVGDALAALSVDADIDRGTVGCCAHCQAAGFFIKRIR